MKTEKMSFSIEELSRSSNPSIHHGEAVVYKIHHSYNSGYSPVVDINTLTASTKKRRRYDSHSDDSRSQTDYSDDSDADLPRKKHRTTYTNYQVIELERYYSVRKYLAIEDRPIIAKKLQLNQTQIKWWFQNRRMKEKRQLKTTTQPYFHATDQSGFVGVGKPAPRMLPTQYIPPVYFPYVNGYGSSTVLPCYPC